MPLCRSDRPTWWCADSSDCSACVRRTTEANASPGCHRTRTGSVFANRPIIDSTPGTSDDRPDTVVPNTTSSRFVSLPSTTAHAVCTHVLSVTPSSRARSVGAATVSSRRRGRGVPPAVASSVGSASESALRHSASDASVSCAASHSWYVRNAVTGRRASPRYLASSSCTRIGADQPSVAMWCSVSTSHFLRTSATRSIGAVARSKRTARSAAATSWRALSDASHGTVTPSRITCSSRPSASWWNDARSGACRSSTSCAARRIAAGSTGSWSSTVCCTTYTSCSADSNRSWKKNPACSGEAGSTSAAAPSSSTSDCVSDTSGKSDGVCPPSCSDMADSRVSASVHSSASADTSSSDSTPPGNESVAVNVSPTVSALISRACPAGIAGSTPARSASAESKRPR